MLGTMRRTMMPLVLAAMLASAVVAAQPQASLPAELGWVKFRISAGRLQLVNTHYRESKTFESGNPLVGTSETFRLNGSSQNASVHYRMSGPRQVLTVDFESPTDVVIEQSPGKDLPPEASPTAMKYEQSREGGVRLIVDEDGRARRHEADNFWALMLLAPTDTQEHLLPVLLKLRPGWPLAETADGIEEALVQLAGSESRPDRRRWEELVGQLGSRSFQQRRSAERRLREVGPAVLAYLKSIPLEQLDAERRTRIERLLEALSSSTDDTPGRVAMWLIDDPLIWTSVLESEDAAHRAVAKEQLQQLLDREIGFDVDADADVRREQIDALRAALDAR